VEGSGEENNERGGEEEENRLTKTIFESIDKNKRDFIGEPLLFAFHDDHLSDRTNCGAEFRSNRDKERERGRSIKDRKRRGRTSSHQQADQEF
jgi:hypothetical protein